VTGSIGTDTGYWSAEVRAAKNRIAEKADSW
jgi:hypothetical protein